MDTLEGRRPYNVGVWRIGPTERRTFRRHVPDPDTQWWSIIHADDTAAIGEPVTYQVWLTDEGRDAFQRQVDDPAGNGRFIEEDQVDTEAAAGIPEPSALAWLGVPLTGWTGAGVKIASLDGGTTQAVRDAIGCVLFARANFSTETIPDTNTITSDHGCKVAPLAVPAGADFIDVIISSNTGATTHSRAASGMTYAADLGAKVINYSFSGDVGSQTSYDAMVYLRDRGVQLYCAAGNDGLYVLKYPAAYCVDFPNVHGIIGFDLDTDTRHSTSNYHELLSGSAPGKLVLTLDSTAASVRASGTSYATPLVARMCAIGTTGGQYTAAAVAKALDATCRDTSEPSAEEGGGAYRFDAAIAYLERLMETVVGRADVSSGPLALIANTEETVIFTDGLKAVEILTLNATASVYFTVDNTAPTVGGKRCYIATPGVGSAKVSIPQPGYSGTRVRLISAAAATVAVTKA